MQALVSRQSAAVLALLFAAGCATKPPTQKEEVSVWLSESPRAIAIKVEPQLPSPSIGTRDHQGGKRVAKGAAAGAGGAAGLQSPSGRAAPGWLGSTPGPLRQARFRHVHARSLPSCRATGQLWVLRSSPLKSARQGVSTVAQLSRGGASGLGEAINDRLARAAAPRE